MLKDDINKKIEKYKKASHVWFIGVSIALLINLLFSLEDPMIIIIGFLIFSMGMLIYSRLVLNYYLLLREVS